MEEEPHSSSRVRFGAFDVDIDERDLRRDGVKVKLNEKPFQVLALLLERAGRIVRRDEIRSRLWPADTYVDFGANLNTALSTLRHALGDCADSPKFIETIPRQGYRFIAAITVVSDSLSVADPLVSEAQHPATLACATPLAPNDSAEPPIEHAEHISENALSDAATVVATQKLRPSRFYLAAVACALILAAIAGGISLRRSYKSSADATNAARSHTTQRPAREINADAYDHYLRGLYALNSSSASVHADSVREFKRAIELDSNFPSAYVGLAQAYIIAAQWAEMDSKQGYTLAKESANKALRMDDSLADAHMLLGMELYQSEWDWSGADKEFKLALKESPNSAHAMRNYASYLVATQRYEEAMAEYKNAEKIDPNPISTGMSMCMLLTLARNFDQAVVQCGKSVEQSPKSLFVKYYLGAAYVYTGHFAEAVATAKQGGRTSLFLSELAIAYARQGNKPAAEKILADLESDPKIGPVSNYGLAEICSELGKKETALKFLRRSLDEHSSDLLFLAQDPDFDNLRDTADYKQIVAQIGLPQPPRTSEASAAQVHPEIYVAER